MNKIVTGLIGLAIFIAFTWGLAISIKEIPFKIIVVIIGCMAAYGLYEEVKEDREKGKEN